MVILRWSLSIAALLTPSIACSAQDQTAVPEDRLVAASVDTDGARAIDGINRFTLDLYKQAVRPRENIVLSPASVSTAIALAYHGAKGTTADEIRATLHYSAAPDAYLRAQAPVLRGMDLHADGRELRVANALWLEEDLPLVPGYLADVSAYATAGVQRVNYRDDAEAARRTINGWVAEHTGNRITDLLHDGDVSDQTRATLVNTLYWKGRWSKPFAVEATKPASFTGLDGRQSTTLLMSQRSMFRAIKQDGVRAIELPYGRGELSMVVLLPDKATGLPRLERELGGEALTRWTTKIAAAPPRDTILILPRFGVGWHDDLVPVLTQMGVHAAFGDMADFSNIATEPYPGEVPGAVGLSIEHVIHQARFDVDENGSEATAATAAVMDVVVTGAIIHRKPPPPFIFRSDKPFLFLLRDRRTKAVLFVGRYVTPSPAATPAGSASPPPR